ncbi:hypothetical protein CANMA_001753 [Candida margitis]|uniref:uncharacterized protein n=1 Tax=Candida margitis TaxID=1775924 RepID=UPI002227A4CC|nr:uncharacterized protein CANMA_001753 [Candida margitis]KAI5969200.1 hypothetical protein CANMA_001753 [Candida margitis]
MDKIDRLLKWANDNGADISSNIEFREIKSNYFGAIATTSGKASIRIPRELVITCDKASALFKDAYKEASHGSLLKVYLCYQQTQHDFYKPYLDLLPSLKAIDSPYTWSAEEKAYLKGTNLGNSLRENIAFLVEEWWSAVNLLPEDIPKPESHFINLKFYYENKFYTDDDYYRYFNDVDTDNWTSFPNYLWASLILKSRAFPAYIIDPNLPKNEPMLLPVVDLLNHNPKAKVEWSCLDGAFIFESDDVSKGEELFNNYGQKGNEELLLAYGFAIENNPADSSALKIKIPDSRMDVVKDLGIELPSIHDYTNSVVEQAPEAKTEQGDGVLFYINQEQIPDSLIQLFQALVQNQWESGFTLRMKFAGLNHLRAALETKKGLMNLNVPNDTTGHKYIRWYIESQNAIFMSAIKIIKRQEKQLLSEYKSDLTSLKSVYKNDVKFQQSLLFLGFSSYETVLESEFQDQCWLLWLIRCYNKDNYGDENLPQWIHDLFVHLRKITDISTQEVLNFKPIHDALVPDLAKAVPEIYNVGDWSIAEFIIAAKLLDTISFTRGKEQECIIVRQNYKT